MGCVDDHLLCWIGSFWSLLEPLTRIWGGLTSVVLLTVGVDLLFVHQLAGGFAIAAALITGFLETTWVISLGLQICLRNENHPVYKYCWFGVLWVDTWKKTLIYSILAVLIVVQPHREWFSIVAAMTLIALGLLHFARWYSSLYKVQPSLLESQSNDIEGYHNNDLELDLSTTAGPIVMIRRTSLDDDDEDYEDYRHHQRVIIN